MHPPEHVAAALALGADGLTATEIARKLGIPRPTVRDWLAGALPRRSREPTCEFCNASPHVFETLPLDYAYLLGLYLGDGTISRHPRDVFKMRIFLDRKYPDIINECAKSMAAVMPQNQTGQRLTESNCVEVYSYSRAWPCLFPQHGPGMKHTRKIALTTWQREHVRIAPELLLRGLIQSDGCRFINTGRKGWRHPRYSFSNASEDIQRIFCWACDLVGLRWTLAPRTVYVSRKADVALLDRFVGPKS